jgi:hypothetical protein
VRVVIKKNSLVFCLLSMPTRQVRANRIADSKAGGGDEQNEKDLVHQIVSLTILVSPYPSSHVHATESTSPKASNTDDKFF